MRKNDLLFCVLLSSLILGCQKITDFDDQSALRKQCHIPDYAELKIYQGFPSTNGFGQREGLSLSAVFEIPEAKVKEFEQFVQTDAWRPLPIPVGQKQRLPQLGRELETYAAIGDGVYRCHTAGDDVLHFKNAQPCDVVKLLAMQIASVKGMNQIQYKTIYRLNDAIISIYERKTRRIFALIESSY